MGEDFCSLNNFIVVHISVTCERYFVDRPSICGDSNKTVSDRNGKIPALHRRLIG